jgi:hypothetical protein
VSRAVSFALQCLGAVLANFISKITFPPKTNTSTTGNLQAVCPKDVRPELVCVKNTDLVTLATDEPTCATGEPTCAAGETAVCCKTVTATTGTNCQDASQGTGPRCEFVGPTDTITTVSASVTVSGFFTDNCGMAPGGCIACMHCCKQAFGKDADAVTKCEKSFCNTVEIFDRHAAGCQLPCVLRVAGFAGALTHARARRSTARGFAARPAPRT